MLRLKSKYITCSSLTSINIPSSVTSLGRWCFEGCSSLKTVTCEIPAPIGDNFIFFDYAPINEATLYVPEASLNSYKTTSPWSGFGTILAIKSSGIETNTVGTSATVDAIYNLEGRRIGGILQGNGFQQPDHIPGKPMRITTAACGKGYTSFNLSLEMSDEPILNINHVYLQGLFVVAVGCSLHN